jgi:hypothetical protein
MQGSLRSHVSPRELEHHGWAKAPSVAGVVAYQAIFWPLISGIVGQLQTSAARVRSQDGKVQGKSPERGRLEDPESPLRPPMMSRVSADFARTYRRAFSHSHQRLGGMRLQSKVRVGCSTGGG